MQRTQVIITLGQDAQINETNNGNTVINFDGAANESWKDKNGNKQTRTTWYRCAYWINNTTIANFLKKGTQIYVEGKPNATAYQDKNGDIVAQNGIIVNKLYLLSSGAKKEEDLQF